MVFPGITAATKKQSGYKDISTVKFHKKLVILLKEERSIKIDLSPNRILNNYQFN